MSTKSIRPGMKAATAAGPITTTTGNGCPVHVVPQPEDCAPCREAAPAERPVCAAAAAGVYCSPACYRSHGKNCETPLPAKSSETKPQTRTIKARYLTAGMTVIDEMHEPQTVTVVHRYTADTVCVYFAGVTDPTSYDVEEGVTVKGGWDDPAQPLAEPDYWETLADNLRQAADRVATLAGTAPTPARVDLSFLVSVSERDAARTMPVVDALASAFGGTAGTDEQHTYQYAARLQLGAIHVHPYTYAPDPELSEVERLRARVAELEAERAQGGAR